MPLPILQPHADPTSDDLMRYFARTELHWARQVAADETVLDAGVAFTNAQLPRVPDANRMFDVALPDGMTPQNAFAAVEEHFAAAGTRCLSWTMNPAAPSARTAPMADFLSSRGLARVTHDVLRLEGAPAEPIRQPADLTIIPARASFRHTRAIAEDAAREYSNDPDDLSEQAEASLLHLDDPHTDALLALRGGDAVAYIAVLAVGEIGVIAHLHVAAPFRRQGIGLTMLGRGLEICARSLFRHVFIEADPQSPAATSLYHRCGFRKVGDAVSFRALNDGGRAA
jgi:ribosomal protein S18 acetylase RimI-like enzyme